MSDPITCKCGNVLGDKFSLFLKMKEIKFDREHNKNYKDTDVENLEIEPSIDDDVQDIFEILHINKMCCRMHINTSIDFKTLEHMSRR